MNISSIMPTVLPRTLFAFHLPVLVSSSVLNEQSAKHRGSQVGELGTPPETGGNLEKYSYWLCPGQHMQFALREAAGISEVGSGHGKPCIWLGGSVATDGFHNTYWKA